MHPQPASAVVLPVASCRRYGAPLARAHAQRTGLSAATIGYMVPMSDFTGRVHSAFAQACNVACNGTLLTIGAFRVGDGPVTARLADGAAHDLQALFEVGARVTCRDGRIRAARAEIDLQHAQVWRPAHPVCSLTPALIGARVADAAAVVAQHRQAQSSVIDREAATTVAALGAACRTLDVEAAAKCVVRLVGWGEGLTPAGDDFLVGLLAGLDLFARHHQRRSRFRAAIAAAIKSCMPCTTPIAAHYLQLAAGGHYSGPIVDLRHALLADGRYGIVKAALHRALAIGATSGADTVSGLLAGLAAWMPSPLPAAQAPS